MIRTLFLALLLSSTSVHAATRFEQRIGERLPEGLWLLDETNTPVSLVEVQGNRPLLLTLSYSRCPNLCHTILDGLSEGVRKSGLVPGRDFTWINVSIDPNESAALSSAKRRAFSARFGDTGVAWHFLRGDPLAVAQLAAAIGYHYELDPISHEYDHPSGAVVITREGKISRYFFGIRFDGPELAAAIRQAKQGALGSRIAALLLYCLHYDPESGPVGRRVLFVIRLSGLVTVAMLALALVRLSRATRGPS